MGRAQIHHSQHHEDEGLQRNDENVEDGPRHVKHPLHIEGQQSNQDEYHFTGVHVTEQTQRQTQRLGQQAEHFQEEVERNQRPVVERGQGQFTGKAANALDLDAVENDQCEHRDRDTEGTVRVGGRYDLEVDLMRIHAQHILAEQRIQLRDVVHRNPLQGVHQEHPDKDGQSQGSNQRVTPVESVLDDALDELHHDFNEVLQSAGGIDGGTGGHETEQADKDQT